MTATEAVLLAYREARRRGELDHAAFERAVAVYRGRYPEIPSGPARGAVAAILDQPLPAAA